MRAACVRTTKYSSHRSCAGLHGDYIIWLIVIMQINIAGTSQTLRLNRLPPSLICPDLQSTSRSPMSYPGLCTVRPKSPCPRMPRIQWSDIGCHCSCTSLCSGHAFPSMCFLQGTILASHHTREHKILISSSFVGCAQFVPSVKYVVDLGIGSFPGTT